MPPRLVRPVAGRLQLTMPYHPENRAWIKDALGSGIRPTWNRSAYRWEIAREHLTELIKALVARFGAVDVVMYFSATQKCDTRCQQARGDECVCSCLGVHHGGANWRLWTQVGVTTLIDAERHVRELRITWANVNMIR